MLNQEYFRQDLETKLQNTTQNKRVAFAIRTLLRILPLLAWHNDSNKIPFTSWTETDKTEYLLNVFSAVSYGIQTLIKPNNGLITHPNFSKTATYTNIIADEIIKITYTIMDNIQIDNQTDNFSVIIKTIQTCITAANQYDDITLINDIYHDLMQLEYLNDLEFLQQPLSINSSTAWQQLIIKFKQDILIANTEFDSWLNWYNDRLNGLAINIEQIEQWNTIPKEIYKQGIIAIKDYIKNLDTKNQTLTLNQVRAIFIGDNTHNLLKSISKQTITEDNDIVICQELIPNTQITAHLWSFKFKSVAQQLFFRGDCLYVLALNSNHNNTQQVEYWLTQLQCYIESIKIIIVAHKNTVDLDMEYLQNKYPDSLNFYQFCQYKQFKQDFYQILQTITIHKTVITKQQLNLIQFFQHQEKQKIFLSQREFLMECDKQNITDQTTQNSVINTLDKLGIIIYTHELNYLEEYLLNPLWLNQNINRVMQKTQGEINIQNAITILHNVKQNACSSAECRFILNIMQNFKLCYLLPNENNIIIPSLLPSNAPKTVLFEKIDALTLEIEFDDYVSQTTMFDIIHHFYEDIINNIVWQQGMLVKSHLYCSHALLELNQQRCILSIWVKGKDAMDYLSYLSYELSKIFSYCTLTYKEWVFLPDIFQVNSNKHLMITERVSYQQVLAFIKKRHWFYLSETGTEYNLKKLLICDFSDDKNKVDYQISGLKYNLRIGFIIFLTMFFPVLASELNFNFKDYILEYAAYFVLMFVSSYLIFNRFCSCKQINANNIED